MPQERLTMRKIKEILRLKYEAGLSNRAIAGACNISNSTVGEYLRRAAAAGIGWPVGELSEDELYEKWAARWLREQCPQLPNSWLNSAHPA
jgi:IS30 family transposase